MHFNNGIVADIRIEIEHNWLTKLFFADDQVVIENDENDIVFMFINLVQKIRVKHKYGKD